MKNSSLVILLAITFGLCTSLAMGEESSAEMGRKLFNDPALGGSTNPQSCNSCHIDGNGLEEAGSESNVAETINFCIERPLKGNKLEVDSTEMKSLILYIKTLNQ